MKSLSMGGGGESLPNVFYTVDENKVYFNPLVYTIEYNSTDGKIVEPYSTSRMPFLDTDGKNIEILSNTYENGKGIIKLQKECYQIGRHAFQDCKTLSSITIPNSVTSINYFAFSGCTSLTGITTPDSLTSIGNSAFFYCISLAKITIPNKVTSIEIGAFKGCTSLSNITVLPETPPTLEDYVFNGIASNAVIYVPSDSVNAYKSATNWSDYADIIEAIS